jgi:uncharacterized membrane protein
LLGGKDLAVDRKIIAIFLIVILTIGLLPLPSGQVAAVPIKEPLATPDGLMWADPIKVTENDLDDQYPSIRLDSEGNADILYLQSGAEYMWAEVTPPSNILINEKRLLSGFIPTQYQVKNESTPQPTEYFDVGPDDGLHVVWTEAGLMDNRYRKFDQHGEPVNQVVSIDQVVSLSRLPYLVVGHNNRAYIAFENEGTAWVQMTYVDDKGFIRAPALLGRPGENVAYAKDAKGDMHLFYRSLGADVSMFHVKIDEDRNPIVPNDIIFPNTSKIANPYSSMPNIAITPNGHVHLLLSDTTIAPHPIYYIELDEEGTPISNFTKIVEKAYNYGDIVADPENNVYVFWDDVSDGEVHYVRMIDGAPTDEVTISSTGGNARYPQVIADGERGDIHLVYVDISEGGEGEVIYRYANSYLIALVPSFQGDVIEVHPGGPDTVVKWKVDFKGEVPVTAKVKVAVDHNGLEGHGWSFELQEETLELGQGTSRQLEGLLKGPDTGDEGEAIDVTVSVVPDGFPAKGKTSSFSAVLTITRGLSITGPSTLALKTRVTEVMLNVKNIGDVTEDVNLSVFGVLPGWNATLDLNNTTIQSPGKAAVVLKITLPDWSCENEFMTLTVEAVPVTVPMATERFDMLLLAYPSLLPLLYLEKEVLPMEPGEAGSVQLEIWNDGLKTGVFEFSSAATWAKGDWFTSIEPEVVTVAPDSKAFANVTISSSQLAEAGLGLSLMITATDVNRTVTEDAVLNVVIKEVGELNVSGGGIEEAYPGERAVFDVLIDNDANFHRALELSAMSLPPGWKWQYWKGTNLSMLIIGPYSSVELELRVTVAHDAPMGPVQVMGTVMDLDDIYDIQTSVFVLPTYGTEIEADVPIKKAALGGEASFKFRITNTGTAIDIYTLSAEGLPLGVSHSWDTSDWDKLSISPGETEEVELFLTMSDTMKPEDFSFFAGAISRSGSMARTEFFIEFRLPDVRIKDVVFDKKDIKDGDRREVTVRLANSGDWYANNIQVNLNGKVKQISLKPGEDGNLTFNVTFSSGDKKLVVVVDPDNDIRERKEDNNAYIEEVEVQERGGLIPGFEPSLLLMAVVVASVMVLIFKRKE